MKIEICGLLFLYVYYKIGMTYPNVDVVDNAYLSISLGLSLKFNFDGKYYTH